jgi:hypothetical protein
MARIPDSVVLQLELTVMIVMIVNELFGGLAHCGIPFEPHCFLVWFKHLLNVV